MRLITCPNPDIDYSISIWHFSSYLPYGPRTQQQPLSNWAGPNLLIDGEKMLRDPLHWPLSDYKVPVKFKTPDGPNKDVGPLQWSYCDQDAHWQTEVLNLPSTSSEEWAVDSTWSHCVLLSRASGRVLRRIDSDQFTSLNQTMYYHHPVSCDWFCQKKYAARIFLHKYKTNFLAEIQNMWERAIFLLKMPRIDPAQLLRTLSQLLSPQGGIKSAEEVKHFFFKL